MAVSISSIVPVRSISLPSRLQANSQKIESELNKLKTWKFSSPPGSESLIVALSGLAELYNCIEELVHSPLTQQALNHQQCKTLVEEALDGSVGLLDSCGNARDLLLTMKEHVQTLQSALRRRTGDSSSIESSVHAYICFRKKAKKNIAKSLRDLKKMESNLGSFCLLDLDHNVQMVLKLLRELSGITISVFQSLFVFLSMPLTNTKARLASKWSLLSKLMAVRSAVSERGQRVFNEVGNVDVALCSLHGQVSKSGAKTDVQVVQWRLDTLDCSITGLEAGFEGLFRCLLQHRVSLLNLLTPA